MYGIKVEGIVSAAVVWVWVSLDSHICNLPLAMDDLNSVVWCLIKLREVWQAGCQTSMFSEVYPRRESAPYQ